MTTICVGISHKQAPIAVREQLAIPADQVGARLTALRELPGVREAMIVSTCNRLEIFAAVDRTEATSDILDTLGPVAAQFAVKRHGEDATRHLFRVAASLDSMVPGEAQILGQVKAAAAQAQEAGTFGPELQRSLDRALSAAKRVRTETEIARGAVSVSSIAVELAQKLLGSLVERSVLLLGAGEMGRLAARELRAQGVTRFLVANRSRERADELAASISGISVAYEELPTLLTTVDVVLCSTGAPTAVITRADLMQARIGRRHRPLFLVDLSLPRNVEPSANELENVFVYDLDDLERAAAANRDSRCAHVGKATEIVEEELSKFLSAQHARATVPVIGKLRAHADQVAKAEAEKAIAALRTLDEAQQRCLRAMASAIVNKLLHTPTARLRADAALSDATATLFGLDATVTPVNAAVVPLRRHG